MLPFQNTTYPYRDASVPMALYISAGALVLMLPLEIHNGGWRVVFHSEDPQ